jgi:hypothetical protein
MLNYTYTINNQAGQQVKFNDRITDPNNYIALQEYPEFDIDVKNAEIAKEGQHGIWDFYSFYGKRLVTFSGVIVGTSEANIEVLKAKLLTAFSLPIQPSSTNDGSVTVSWTDASSNSWQIVGKMNRSIRFNRPMKYQLRLNFQVSIKCPSPLIVGSTLNTSNGIRGYRGSLLRLSTLLPLVLDIDYINKLTINNLGSASANTLIRLNNTESTVLTNPKISNITTGQFFKLNTTIPVGGYIEIDSETGTVVRDTGEDISALIDPDSVFILLQSGVNDMLYETDENPLATLVTPTATFSVKYRITTL